jgi:hypothetical protein
MSGALSALAWRDPLFVLSHMRSYSTLLSHVLGSHPDIDGYCETHMRFRHRIDLLRLRYRVTRLTGEPLHGRYVLDKMLHNYALASSIISDPRLRAIFLLRQPADTVRSITAMNERFKPEDVDAPSIAGYYEERVERLAELAPRLGNRAAFIEAEALVNRTAEVLTLLTGFLELSRPLEREYRKFPHTGKPGFGDPMGAILKGAIDAPKDQRTHIPIPEDILARLAAAYDRCRAVLSTNCVSLASETAPLVSQA